MKDSSPKKSNSTVAISQETAIRLDLFCKKSDITKKDFISLSLDFFEKTGLTPKDAEQVIVLKKRVEDVSKIEEDISAINSKFESTNVAIANMQGLITGDMIANMQRMFESAMADNNTRLIEEIKPRKKRWIFGKSK